ncbi:glycosyltransferase [Flavobacterium luteum]|uniref:Glycosyltransferase n=1 Tax=Flavobacterium luteum TaxID=2026654 RepID=A0A7J5AK92_9FLAO|nr:glycosyltransferase [Flavobacterium luteum]KAB1158022.1 glycosyltransferase [Flavobacterium luteum]
MKILLLGECSNLHSTLADGLKALGHDVTVASDGSKWMDNHRDINTERSSYDLFSSIKYLVTVHNTFRSFKDYDIVQINNPLFLDLKIKRNLNFYRYLKKYNAKIFLGAFGTDYFWEKSCFEGRMFRYSDYFIGELPTSPFATNILKKEWLGTQKQEVNIEIAESCNGIIACLYEYYKSYEPYYNDKLAYIPLPINTSLLKYKQKGINEEKLKFFIGIQKDRSEFKGTDIMYKALLNIHDKYPKNTSINKVESIPLNQYVKMMSESDILLDQIYSYTPAMNGLIAMAQGLILVGGGEPEMYELLHEKQKFPIINVFPTEEDIYNKLETLITNKNAIPNLSSDSRFFVEKYHDYIKVAQQYIDFWNSK